MKSEEAQRNINCVDSIVRCIDDKIGNNNIYR